MEVENNMILDIGCGARVSVVAYRSSRIGCRVSRIGGWVSRIEGVKHLREMSAFDAGMVW